jgi:hypothetical protein
MVGIVSIGVVDGGKSCLDERGAKKKSASVQRITARANGLLIDEFD